jgi:hypothetical protein
MRRYVAVVQLDTYIHPIENKQLHTRAEKCDEPRRAVIKSSGQSLFICLSRPPPTSIDAVLFDLARTACMHTRARVKNEIEPKHSPDSFHMQRMTVTS